MRCIWTILLAPWLVAAGCKSSTPEHSSPGREIAAASDPQPPPAPPPAPPSGPIWTAIGVSHQHRPLLGATLGRGPYRVYLIGGIHGDEPEGQQALPEIIDMLSRAPHADGATIRIIRDANPDGTAARRRGNARGRDLNRNWPAANFAARAAHGSSPLSEPESAALDRDLTGFAPQLVIVLHAVSGGRGPFVNFDGPAARHAAAFADAARAVDPRWKVVPQMGYPTPGSLGSYLGVDRGVPILTIEFQRGQDADSVTAAALRGVAAAIAVGPS